MLSGGASRVEGFAEALRERFHTEVELFDPFRQVAFDAAKLGRRRRGDGAGVGGGARSRAAPSGGPMIRVNLIAGERRPAKAAGRSLQIGQKIAARRQRDPRGRRRLLVGWRYWALDQHAAQRRPRHRRRAREEARLAEVLKQVARLRGAARQLQERVTLIDDLRHGQTAPVHIVDQISRSLPEMIWLTSLKQDGYDVTIEGRSTTLAALSDFVGNLEATRYFSASGRDRESEVVTGDERRPDLIEFTIKGTFQMAGIDPAAGRRRRRGDAGAGKGGKVG